MGQSSTVSHPLKTITQSILGDMYFPEDMLYLHIKKESWGMFPV